MKILLLFILPLLLSAKTDFITQMEYASALYKNPRGIGCNKCHGDDGEGKLVAKYIHKEKKKEFRGSEINSIEFSKFYKALNKKRKGMPRYYLTKKEIKALYFYLQEKKIKNEK